MRQKIYFSLFIGFISLITCCKAFSQSERDELSDRYRRLELGVTIGASNFLGDLGGNTGIGGPFLKDYTFITVRPLEGLSLAYYPNNGYQLKFGFNFTKVTGADSLIKQTNDEARWRIYRNLSFRSSIFEAYIAADVYVNTLLDKTHSMRRMNPFISAGAGIFHFNPQAQLDGQWVDLQPLHLEGQGFPEYPSRKNYSLTQLYFPFAVGIKYYISNRIAISGGFRMRKTFTDYIDDVSTTYIDPSLFAKYLSPSNAILANELYSRSLRPSKVRPGVDRGHSNNNDTYLDVFISIHIPLSRSIAFYYGGSNGRNGRIYY